VDEGESLSNVSPHLDPLQVISQTYALYSAASRPVPSYTWDIPTNIRNITAMYETNYTLVLENTARSYDSFLEDLAVVTVYFDSPTAWEFTGTLSSTWIVYLSNVGGLYGLCVGFSLATVVELVWLGWRLFLATDIPGLILEKLSIKMVGRPKMAPPGPGHDPARPSWDVTEDEKNV
jgi:hypothetical protein